MLPRIKVFAADGTAATFTTNDNNAKVANFDGEIEASERYCAFYPAANASDYNTNYLPYSTSKTAVNTTYNYYGYGPSTNMTDKSLVGTSANYDWGYYNAIINGGNQPNQWRTLTHSEWRYILRTRTTNSGLRYAKANVNNVNGIILLPDDWMANYFGLNNTDDYTANFNSNVINESDWANSLQVHGAVVLPAALIRDGTTMSGEWNGTGFYWSTTANGSKSAYVVSFSNTDLVPAGNSISSRNRYYGLSVRLVCPVE